MALLEDMKAALRVTSGDFDSEVQMLIDAAKADMRRVGISEEKLAADDPMVKLAVYAWCKAEFGFDNSDAAFFQQSYRQAVADMLNSGGYNGSMGGGDEQV